MLQVSSRIIRIKLIILGIAVTFGIIGFLKFMPEDQVVRASASGPTESHTGAPGESSCTACHADFPINSGSGSVLISGLPANYLPNQQIPVTFTVNEANAVVFGFQMTVVDSLGKRIGTFSFPAQTPQPLQIVSGFVGGYLRDYISHTSNGITPTQFGTKSWTFNWRAPATRAGKVSFYAAGNGANSDNNTSGDFIYSTSKSTLSGSAIANFDGDIKSDISVFRPSTGVWYSLNTIDGNFQAVQFGTTGDKVVAGDYDGDGKSDFAVWRPSTGVWYVLKSSGGFLITQFGVSGDVPVVGDYDGDLKSDLAVWRPSTGVWYIWKSSDNNFIITGFGLNGDKPVQGDYDSDGKTDIAVFRPSNGVWYVLRSRDGFTASQFGVSTDRPAPADFDGDGKTDISIYRNGVWYILKSSDGGAIIASFGTDEDVPAPGGYIAE